MKKLLIFILSLNVYANSLYLINKINQDDIYDKLGCTLGENIDTVNVWTRYNYKSLEAKNSFKKFQAGFDNFNESYFFNTEAKFGAYADFVKLKNDDFNVQLNEFALYSILGEQIHFENTIKLQQYKINNKNKISYAYNGTLSVDFFNEEHKHLLSPSLALSYVKLPSFSINNIRQEGQNLFFALLKLKYAYIVNEDFLLNVALISNSDLNKVKSYYIDNIKHSLKQDSSTIVNFGLAYRINNDLKVNIDYERSLNSQIKTKHSLNIVFRYSIY
ncbi:hypothetical protein AVCANL279_08385 [Campylobacter canadensis]|uniref:hypothetical protein n=1 Tax=Campylobacter canadensis TaxID=449520 RepID=UPI001557ADC6|nr:hypothetical protein [Campylobacter canadensis]MBZ7995511.1 hypothetical protein [Campylobacter canadensis]MBZ7997328.1 hypothetical protein [Campylobacter canadensis]MBZ8000877.1 hypothetical protein [Campylobacter canadensis]MBZ8002677.1 hypothetical protein [Campylobacter canadensis]MBZ8003516.1 hypothetical protein [Campylobacter canadensis]